MSRWRVLVVLALITVPFVALAGTRACSMALTSSVAL